MSDQQPTLDELWFVFQTVIQASQLTDSQFVDQLTFAENYDQDKLRELDYKRWHNKIGRATTALFKAACQPLAASGLLNFTLPDEVPTLEVTPTAQMLYTAAQTDLEAFGRAMTGESSAPPVTNTQEDEPSPAPLTELSDGDSPTLPLTPSLEDTLDDSSSITHDPTSDLPGELISPPTSSLEHFDSLHSSDSVESNQAVEMLNPSETLEVKSPEPIQNPDSDIEQSTPNQIGADSTSNPDVVPEPPTEETPTSNKIFDTDPPEENINRQLIELDGNTHQTDDLFASRQQGSGRRPLFGAETAENTSSTRRRTRKLPTNLNAEDSSPTSSSQPQPKQRQNRTTMQGESLGQGRSARQLNTNADNQSEGTNQRRRLRSTEQSDAKPSTPSQRRRTTFGARLTTENVSEQQSAERPSYRRRVIRDNASEQESTMPSSASSLPSSPEDSHEPSTGPRRRITNTTETHRPVGPRARIKAQNLQPQSEEDVQIVPLPNGEEKRFSKAVLDTLIEEHGSLTEVINWYMAMESEQDRKDEESD